MPQNKVHIKLIFQTERKQNCYTKRGIFQVVTAKKCLESKFTANKM
jgi:hypothetical protein